MKRELLIAGTALLTSGLSMFAWADKAPDSTAAKNLPGFVLLNHFSEAKFATVPGLPECTKMVGLHGDPSKGPSTLMVRMDGGCAATYHWHSANEEMIILQGTAKAQIDGQGIYVLKTGSYMVLPAKTKHRFKCISKKPCILSDGADAPFDVHNVDESGKEMSAEDALRAAADPANLKW